MKTKTGLLFILLWLSVLCRAGVYPLYQLPEAPVIDGKADSVWDVIPAGQGFRFIATGQFVLQKSTWVKAAVKDETLYLLIHCEEPNPEKLNAVESYKDGWVVDDAVEIFLKPAGKKMVHFTVNAKNARWLKWQDALHASEPPEEWKSAVQINPSDWTVEMAIPFSILQGRPELFNIGRNLPGYTQFKRFSCLAKTREGYAEIKYFDRFQFSPLNGCANPEDKESEFNPEYDRFLTRAIRELAAGGQAYQNLKVRYGKRPEFQMLEKLRSEGKKQNQMGMGEKSSWYLRWNNTAANIATPRREIMFHVSGKQAGEFRCYLNGKEIPAAGEDTFRLTLSEGLSCVSFSAKATGKDPQLEIRLDGVPENSGRWKAAAGEVKGWNLPDFDDRGWKKMQTPWPAAGADRVFLRQNLIWNETYDGKMRCLNPSMKEWGFSAGATEFMILSIYSAVPYPAAYYAFCVEVPEGMELLDNRFHGTHKLKTSPLKIEESQVTRDGKKYRRYILTYDAKAAYSNSLDRLSSLAIRNNTLTKAGDRGKIYVYRMQNDNITEIPTAIPYVILPPIQGKMTKLMKFGFYGGYLPVPFSKAEYKAQIADAAKAGFNLWHGYPWVYTGDRSDFKKNLKENGAEYCVSYNQYPIWGAVNKKQALYQLMEKHPELQVRRFKDEKKNFWAIPYCTSTVLDLYQKEFSEAVEADYREMFRNHPDARFFFLNWEYRPWGNDAYRKAKTGTGYCFCERCKKHFKAYAGIPEQRNLPDDEIFQKYYYEWEQFRYHQDGKLHHLVLAALQKTGKSYLFYSDYTHQKYWKELGDISKYPGMIFLGCPGNGQATGQNQPLMDSLREYQKRTNGISHIQGQRFVYAGEGIHFYEQQHEAWKSYVVHSEDGFVNPPTWKEQTLRICAALRGGVDIHRPDLLVGGIKYYIGEATRLLADHEAIFWDGERRDSLASSKEIAYPDLLVLKHGKERMVLLFNSGDAPKKVTIRNLNLEKGQKGKLYYSGRQVEDPSLVSLTIPAHDVEALWIH